MTVTFRINDTSNMTTEELYAEQIRLEQGFAAAYVDNAEEKFDDMKDKSTHPVMFSVAKELVEYLESNIDDILANTKSPATEDFKFLGKKEVAVLVVNHLLKSAASASTSRQKTIDNLVELFQFSLVDKVLNEADHTDENLAKLAKQLSGNNKLTVREYQNVLKRVADQAGIISIDFENPCPVRAVVQKMVQCVTGYNNMFEEVEVQKEDRKTKTIKAVLTFQFTHSAVLRFKGLSREMAQKRAKCLPMLVQPRDWTSLSDGGFLTKDMQIDLIKLRGSIPEKLYYKSTVNHTLADAEWLVGLNHMQKTGFKVDKKVLSVANKIEKAGGGMLGMASTKPIKTAGLKGAEKKNAKYEESRRQSKRYANDTCLELARMYKNVDAFYYVLNADFRGRIYTSVNVFSYQGDSLAKGLLRFAEEKPLGPNGYKHLCVMAATCYGHNGLDKESINAKYAWANSAEGKKIIKIAAKGNIEDPLFKKYIIERDLESPFQFIQVAQELSKLVDKSDKVRAKFKSSVVCGQDGSNNGSQHCAASLRSKTLAKSVNMLPADEDTKPEDLYWEVAQEMTKVFEEHTPEEISMLTKVKDKDALDVDLCAKLRDMYLNAPKKVKRASCKTPTMVMNYGGTVSGRRDQLEDNVYRKGLVDTSVPVEAFKSVWGWALERALDGKVGASKKLNKFLSGVARAVGEKPMQLVTPAGFVMLSCYHKTQEDHVVTGFGRKIMRIQFKTQLPDINVNKTASAAAPNRVHGTDAAHAMLTSARCAAEGIEFGSIHDDFFVHACNIDRLNVLLREEFLRIYENESPLEEVLRQAIEQGADPKKLPEIPYASEDDWYECSQLRDAVNFFV